MTDTTQILKSFEFFTAVRGFLSFVLALAAITTASWSILIFAKKGNQEYGQGNLKKDQISLKWKGRGSSLIILAIVFAFSAYLVAPKSLKYTERITPMGREVHIEQYSDKKTEYISINEALARVETSIKEKEELLARLKASNDTLAINELKSIEMSLAELTKERDRLSATKNRLIINGINIH